MDLPKMEDQQNNEALIQLAKKLTITAERIVMC